MSKSITVIEFLVSMSPGVLIKTGDSEFILKDMDGSVLVRGDTAQQFGGRIADQERQAARDRVVEAVVNYFEQPAGARFNDKFNAMQDAFAYLKSLGAEDE